MLEIASSAATALLDNSIYSACIDISASDLSDIFYKASTANFFPVVCLAGGLVASDWHGKGVSVSTALPSLSVLINSEAPV